MKDQNGAWLVNTQVGVRSPEQRYEFLFWVNNLTDKRMKSIVFNTPVQSGTFSTFMTPPRMMGVTLTTRF